MTDLLFIFNLSYSNAYYPQHKRKLTFCKDNEVNAQVYVYTGIWWQLQFIVVILHL